MTLVWKNLGSAAFAVDLLMKHLQQRGRLLMKHLQIYNQNNGGKIF